MTFEEQLYEHLQQLGIQYQRYEHPAVHTIEEAQEHWADLPGARCKNLFLRDQKGKTHYLVVLEQDKAVDMKAFTEANGLGKLSFASAERLKTYLNLEQGAVSPFGLLWEGAKDVLVYLDKDLAESEYIGFHPNVNTATIVLKTEDFMKFLKERGNALKVVQI